MNIGEAPMFWQAAGKVGRYACTPWPKHLGISDQLLEHADPEQVQHGDGFVRFSLFNDASVLYGIAHAAEGRPGINHYDRIDA